MPTKIVLCGPPHSGKSCLREGLKRAILAKNLAYPYPYCLPANPDADGAYFFQASWNDAEAADSYRKVNKRPFSPLFISQTATYVETCKLPLVLIDIGGKPWADNKQICQHATHAVILGKTPQDFQEWRGFCKETNLRIIAELRSDFDAAADSVERPDSQNVLRGLVHHLDRQESAENRLTVKELADHILRLTGSKPVPFLSSATFLITPGMSDGRTRLLLTGFGRAASASEMVRDASKALAAVDLTEVEIVLFDGPISVVAASALAWQASRFPIVGISDPKLNLFVIVDASAAVDGWRPLPGGTLSALQSFSSSLPTHDPAKLFYLARAGGFGDGARFDVRPTDLDAPAHELVTAALDQFAEAPTDTPGVLFHGKVPVVVAAALTCAAMRRDPDAYVAFFDPRLNRFVVSASNSKSKPMGMLL